MRYHLNVRPASSCSKALSAHPNLALHFAAAIAFLMMLCFCSTARAQQAEPIFSYDNPSDEMDFDLPPTPDLKSVAPPPPPEDPLSQVDRFFSDAPVLEAPEPEATMEGEADIKKEEPQIKEEPKKKLVRRKPAKPPYNFKTVVLPDTIYRKNYTTENRHLPVARYTSDMERGVIGSAMYSEISSIRALKKMGTPINLIAENGEPVVVIAAREGDVNTVHWLLIQGVDVNAASQEGLTALHYAAFRGSPQMAEVLMSYGAEPNITDNRGVTPLMYAARMGSAETAQTLLKFGADPSAVTVSGRNAMHMAALSRNPEMKALLQQN